MYQSEDISYIFDELGKEVLVNDVPTTVVITNPTISEYEERYIHTLQNVSRGSIVNLEGEKYLSLTESLLKRGAKYKCLVRHCNHVIEIQGETTLDYFRDVNGNIVYDDYGEPILVEVVGESYYIPCIVDNKSLTISGTQLLITDNQIIVIVQDNELNREKFKTNSKFIVMSKNWNVIDIDLSKNGLLIITCESV